MSSDTVVGAAEVMPTTVRMMEFHNGLRLAHLLSVMADLGVADEVADQPLPVAEIAKRTRSDTESLYRALRTVASKGVFTEVEPRVFGTTE